MVQRWVVHLEHHLAGSGHRFRDLGQAQPLGRRRVHDDRSHRHDSSLALDVWRHRTPRGSRSPPLDDTDQTAAARIRTLLGRRAAGGPVPLVVFDAGYDSAQLTLALAEALAAVLRKDQARI